MLCPNCGRDTPNEPLCVNCGLPLRRACPQCGEVTTPDAAACSRCGTQLGPTPSNSSTQFPGFFGGGRYVLKELLGEGGRKRVYLAHDTALDRDVALALIKTEDMDDAAKTRITSDVQSMGHLSSYDNIVSVFNYGEQEEQLFLITELMTGGSVETLLEQSSDHRVSIKRAIAIARDVSKGLEFAHSHDILHLNLKPSHVLMAEDGMAAISDFGLALQKLQLTQDNLSVQAVSYMPPEQAMGSEVSTRSDLYALGCLLYEMVTGRPPFLGDNALAVIGQQINEAPVAPVVAQPRVSARARRRDTTAAGQRPGRTPALRYGRVDIS